jgi:hypothetical protein
VRAEGIGPSTRGLKGRCSTTELRPLAKSRYYTLREVKESLRFSNSTT